jgi:dienelactone hydrolase
MTRRSALALLASVKAGAQQQIAYRDYSRCLPDHLRMLARESAARRSGALSQLKSPEAIAARQQWVRRTFWELAGGEPERTPLGSKTTGAFERETYRVEKFLYESRPGLLITANLYIPRGGRPPYPGVLFQMGHAVNGKAAALYQKCCQSLAALGFVVLAFDPMGQGERTFYPRSDSPLTRLRSAADGEHTVPGQQMLLAGETATRFQTWDAVRSLDLLASHPLVDPKRLASTGNSGGGTLTMFLAAVDDRLAAAAPACPNSENFALDSFNPPGSTDDAEQNFPGAGPLGFDRWDLFYPMAPKPLLIAVSAKDFFGTYSPSYLTSGREEFARLAGVYQALGKPDHIRWWESPLPHGLNYSTRMEIYNWLRRWLQGERSPLESEPAVAPEKDETLWATPHGSILRLAGHVRPVDLARRSVTPAAQPPDLGRLIDFQAPPLAAQFQMLGRASSDGCVVEAAEVASAQHVWLPCWLFRPRKDRGGAVLVALEAAGRNAQWAEDSLCQQLARHGRFVCAPDLRGNGDLSAEPGRGASRYTLSHATEHDYAWASLVLGRNLLGQRVTDILTIVRALSPRPVILAANGKMTVPALFAAALEPRIERLYLSGGLASYRHLIESEEYAQPFANFVPRILLHTDLPGIAAGLAPKPVTVAGAVGGDGRRLPVEEVKRLYPAAVVTEEARWDFESLSAL